MAISIKTPEEIEKMRVAGRLAAERRCFGRNIHRAAGADQTVGTDHAHHLNRAAEALAGGCACG